MNRGNRYPKRKEGRSALATNPVLRQRLSRTSGAAAAEFAIILPVFLLSLFGMIQFGIGWWNAQIITNGSREGARLGVVLSDPAITDSDVVKHVKDYLTGSGMDGSEATVGVSCEGKAFADCTTGDQVRVTVSVPTVRLFEIDFLPFPETLSAESVMRHE